MSDNIHGDQVQRDKAGSDIVKGNKTVNVFNQSIENSDNGKLSAAIAKLAQLPLNAIPSIATLPPNSRLPHSPNPHFTGRQEYFLELARTLKNQDPDSHQIIIITQPTALTGLGGIGKTQLAVEFAHRYGQYFTAVHWVSFAVPASIPAEIAACGRRMNLPSLESMELAHQVERVQSQWESQLPRLLIFDNCENVALLARYRPNTGGARLLVTSRRGNFAPTLALNTFPIELLPRPQSIQLLQRFWPSLTNDRADAIAESLGDLPLALHLTGSYLAYVQGAINPKDLLVQLGQQGPFHKVLTGEFEGYSPTAHDRNVARTFELSYDLLVQADHPLAHRLLINLTHLSPGESVPFDLLQGTFGDDDQRPPDEDLIVARQRLINLGLVTDEPDRALRIHRLLHHFVRRVVSRDFFQETLNAVEVGIDNEVYLLNKEGYPAPLLTWESHLRHLVDVGVNRKDEQVASLASNLGYYLKMAGDYTGARPYYELALAIAEEVLGPDHPDTALSLNNLGMLLLAMGDHTGAQLYLERSLAIREAVLGPKHPSTAISLNNLGRLLQAIGDHAGAQPYFERALTIVDEALGPQHSNTALSLNNLGELLRAMGDHAGARPYLERALTIREDVLGPKHPHTANSLNNLGKLLQAMGDYAGAWAYFEQALTIVEEVLGPNHPDTALSLNNLGGLLKDMGDYSGARSYLERALAIREEVLGPNHPDTALSLNNLGSLLKDVSDHSSARPYLERALTILETKLGFNHPKTQIVQDNLESLED